MLQRFILIGKVKGISECEDICSIRKKKSHCKKRERKKVTVEASSDFIKIMNWFTKYIDKKMFPR